MMFCSRNNVPDGKRICVPTCGSSALAMCSELVSTDRSSPSICGHICRVVVPPSIMIPSPCWQSCAAARPIDRFWARFSVIDWAKGVPASRAAPSGLPPWLSVSRAPPRTRWITPSSSSRERSRRIVAGDAASRDSRAR